MTYRVYEQLSETDLDVHIYGVEDTSLPAEFGFTPPCWYVSILPPELVRRVSAVFG